MILSSTDAYVHDRRLDAMNDRWSESRPMSRPKIVRKPLGTGSQKEARKDTIDADVADFLRGSGDRSSTRHCGHPTPRIDFSTAPRWSSSIHTRIPSNDGPIVERRKRPPRRAGLLVRFERVPEVIGFGGEEFEVPTISISQARHILLHGHQSQRSYRRDSYELPPPPQQPTGRHDILPSPTREDEEDDYSLIPEVQIWSPHDDPYDSDDDYPLNDILNSPSGYYQMTESDTRSISGVSQEQVPAKVFEHSERERDSFDLLRAASYAQQRATARASPQLSERVNSNDSHFESARSSPRSSPHSSPYRSPHTSPHLSPRPLSPDESTYLMAQPSSRRSPAMSASTISSSATESSSFTSATSVAVSSVRRGSHESRSSKEDPSQVNLERYEAPCNAQESGSSHSLPAFSAVSSVHLHAPSPRNHAQISSMTTSVEDSRRDSTSSSVYDETADDEPERSDRGDPSPRMAMLAIQQKQHGIQAPYTYRSRAESQNSSHSPSLRSSLPASVVSSNRDMVDRREKQQRREAIAREQQRREELLKEQRHMEELLREQRSAKEEQHFNLMQRNLHSTTDQALEDFAARVRQGFGGFIRHAENIRLLKDTTLEEMVRAASWWLLKGQSHLEMAAREKAMGEEDRSRSTNISRARSQGNVDLAKALWLISDAVPVCKELRAESFREAMLNSIKRDEVQIKRLLERCRTVKIHLMKLSASMRRNDLLPPALIPLSTHMDTSIWYPPPLAPTNIVQLLSLRGPLHAAKPRPPPSLSDSMPISDTPHHFVYARLFVDLVVMNDHAQDTPPCLCVLSVTRSPNNKALTFYVTDQSGLINFAVQGDKKGQLCWENVTWQMNKNALDIHLSLEYTARVTCSPAEFQILWNTFDHTRRVYPAYQARTDEMVLLDRILKSCRYSDDDPNSEHIFPRSDVYNCHVRLLETGYKQDADKDAPNEHQGFRIAIHTNLATKHLNTLNHDILPHEPIRFEFMRSPEGDPAFALTFEMGKYTSRLAMTFFQEQDRTQLYHLLVGGIANTAHESLLTRVPIQMFSTALLSAETFGDAIHDFFAWQSAQVLRIDDDEGENNTFRADTPDRLRIVVESRYGTITERLNNCRRGIKIRLNTDDLFEELVLCRSPQPDLTFALSDPHVPPSIPEEVSTFLDSIQGTETQRVFRFNTIHDLHAFQSALTGFQILFDGMVDSFTIARPQSLIIISAKWDAALTRVQVLRRGDEFQLAAFFASFAHGDCMNFSLSRRDEYEIFLRGHQWCVRFIEARFALPNIGDVRQHGSAAKGFVQLEEPDFAGEQEEICVCFDSQADCERFAATLPAKVRQIDRGMEYDRGMDW